MVSDKKEPINKKENSKKEARKKRGQINENDLKPFENYGYLDLINMLKNEDPQIRTISATLLNKKFLNSKDNDLENMDIIIKELSHSFKHEKSLYSKIAISDSLVSYGELSVPYIIQLLGQIGNNHEKNLPKKYFNKKSFPLPRDLAARTLSKMGKIPTPFLIHVLNENSSKNCSNFVKEQAIDAIGAIAYKYNDHRAVNTLKTLFESYKNHSPFFSWKIIRSLSGFKFNHNALILVIEILNNYYDYDEVKWESIRSIGQINIINNDVRDILNNIGKENKININNNTNNKTNNSQIELALSIAKNNLNL